MIPLNGEYTPPSVEDFHFDGMFGQIWLTKPFLQALIAAILIVTVWLLAARKLKTIPSKRQYLMELIYQFVRDTIGRDILGAGYRPYQGILLSIFCFILINNWFGEFFLFMFPTFSVIGYTWGVVLVVYGIYVYAGFKAHGSGYIRQALIPQGVPWYLAFLIAPIEFISVFVTRPLTLGVRLFANMFAGHMSIVVAVVGGSFLLTYAHNVLLNAAGLLTLIFSMAIFALELFVGFLQAYIFTILTAQYISSSISESH